PILEYEPLSGAAAQLPCYLAQNRTETFLDFEHPTLGVEPFPRANPQENPAVLPFPLLSQSRCEASCKVKQS
uniref:hypothetical protein n=1 Tax=Alloprevotella sp. TaxID=1872471 RepID=UPI003FEED858